MGDLAYTFTWIESTNMFFFYSFEIWGPQVFPLNIYCSSNMEPHCFNVSLYQRWPQTLVIICRNMDIYDAFTAVAVRENISGHDDVIKWRHFPRYWPFVWGFHRSPVNSLHKGQWRGALMCSLICAWINRWVNNGQAGDLRCYRTHYDVIVMVLSHILFGFSRIHEFHHEKASSLLALCEGNPPVTGGFPSQRANNADHWTCCLTKIRVAGDLRHNAPHVKSVWCLQCYDCVLMQPVQF